MELRTIMKLHFEKLNKRVLELYCSSYEENYEELEVIKNTAREMKSAFDNVDEELSVGVECLQFNALRVQKYIKNQEFEFELLRPLKNEKGKYMCIPCVPENDLDKENLIEVFKLFNWEKYK